MSESLDNKIGKEIRRWRTFRRRSVFVGAFMLMLAMFIMGATDKPCGEGVRTLIQNCC